MSDPPPKADIEKRDRDVRLGQVRTFANAEAQRRVFAREKDIRGRSAEERRLIRQQSGRPLTDAFQKWLRTKRGLISQKGKLADAMRHALSRWKTELLPYGGRIKLDNCPSKASSVYHPQQVKCALRRLRRRRRALPSSLRWSKLQAERRRSARLSCYIDRHEVELGRHSPSSAAYTQQPAFEQRRLLQLRARRRQAVCLGTINGRRGYLHVPGSPRHLCV
jgi:hypothetical protein